MWAKGPMAGAQPRQEALKVLPLGTTCKRVSAMGITGYVVILPGGKAIASAGNAGGAWEKAAGWAQRNPDKAAAAIESAGGAAASGLLRAAVTSRT